MSEQFEIDLKNHIFEVFENYEDLSADAGWALLREKFPEKKKDRAIIWWYSVAAGLLLFLGLFFIPKKKTEEVANHPKTKTGAEVIAADKFSQKHEPAVVSKNNRAFTDEEKGPKENLVQETHQDKHLQHQIAYTKNPAKTEHVEPHPNAVVTTAEQPAIASTKPEINTITNKTAAKQEPAKTADVATIAAPEKPNTGSIIADPVLKMMADDKARQANTAVKTTQPKTESILSVSPYAATYFNYAKGSTNQVNVGAGVTTDVKLSGRLKLSTGVAIAQNTLDFGGNGVPSQAANAAFAYAVVSSPASSLPTGVPPGVSLDPASSFGFYLNGYRANLVGLDVPVNLKYQVSNILSVSGGFSSGTFINETYTTIFGSGNNANNTLSNSNHFGTFDFARTVNFSVGVGYPLGGNHIIVEPFLKYPIGGLGSQNIRFGASGINLKFNFGTQRK